MPPNYRKILQIKNWVLAERISVETKTLGEHLYYFIGYCPPHFEPEERLKFFF